MGSDMTPQAIVRGRSQRQAAQDFNNKVLPRATKDLTASGSPSKKKMPRAVVNGNKRCREKAPAVSGSSESARTGVHGATPSMDNMQTDDGTSVQQRPHMDPVSWVELLLELKELELKRLKDMEPAGTTGPEGEERDVVHMMSDKDSGVVRASIYQAGTGTSAQEERKAGCQEALSRRGARQGVRPLSPLNN